MRSLSVAAKGVALTYLPPTLISGPATAVTAAEAKAVMVFSSDDADAYVNALLAVAQSQIDGLNGWLGRAIGLQTLEFKFDTSCVIDTARLPLPPYVDTVSDTVSIDGLFRWRAGYGSSPATPLPAAIKHAIILMAGDLRDAVPDAEGTLKRIHVEGVGIEEYAVTADPGAGARKAVEKLLAPYRVPFV